MLCGLGTWSDLPSIIEGIWHYSSKAGLCTYPCGILTMWMSHHLLSVLIFVCLERNCPQFEFEVWVQLFQFLQEIIVWDASSENAEDVVYITCIKWRGRHSQYSSSVAVPQYGLDKSLPLLVLMEWEKYISSSILQRCFVVCFKRNHAAIAIINILLFPLKVQNINNHNNLQH